MPRRRNYSRDVTIKHPVTKEEIIARVSSYHPGYAASRWEPAEGAEIEYTLWRIVETEDGEQEVQIDESTFSRTLNDDIYCEIVREIEESFEY